MSSKDQPLISIITINYNSTVVTGELLRSILEHCRYPNYEVIVVDNASREDPTEYLRNISGDVRVIQSGSNLGFSGGNNVGIRAAKGDYFFLVNNDTEFTPGLLESLLDVFVRYPDAGLVSPKLRSFFSKETIEYAGYNKVNVFTGRNGMVGSHETDKGQFDTLSLTHYAHGGAMMISRKVAADVGLMPEIFFLYYEELDWSEQVKRKGYKIYYQPAGLIFHKESMTTGKFSPLKTYYLTRNRILFIRRNLKWYHRMVFMGYLVTFTIPKNSIFFLVQGHPKHFGSFWKGVLWNISNGYTSGKQPVSEKLSDPAI